jgi:hypothetical protein
MIARQSPLLASALPGWILILLLILILPACATLNKKECLNADWRSIGFEDGARGAKTSRIGQHREACAEYSIKPDLDAYRGGREQGLQSYCRPGNGYQVGLSGNSYNDVCPAALENDFVVAYKAGEKIYRLESDIRNLSRTLKQDEKALKALKEELSTVEAELVSNGVASKRRIELLAEVREKGKNQDKLENKIKNQELEMARLQGQVDSLKRESQY